MITHLFRIISLVLVLAMSITVFAQDNSTSSEGALLRQYNTVDSVELVQTETATQLIIRSTLSDGCDFPVVIDSERQGNIWFVDVYRDVPLATICPAVLKTDEQAIEANILYEHIAQADGTSGVIDLIVVNERVFHIERAQFEGTGENVQPPMLLSPWYVSPISVIRLETVLADGDMSLQVPWVPLSGCEGPLVSRIRPVAHAETPQYDVFMYQATDRDPASDACPPPPMLFTSVEETIPVAHDPMRDATFSWETTTLHYRQQFVDGFPFDATWLRNPITVQPDGITATVAESFPPQVFVTVNWQHGGPCPARYYEVLDQRNGNDVTISITEVLAEGTICGRALLPMSVNIALGAFENGIGSITVNGVEASQ